MAIILKSKREIELMRAAGVVVANVLLKIQECAKPGVSTFELDRIALEMTEAFGAEALFKGVPSPYKGVEPFSGAICASINEQIVHGLPSKAVKLKDGDILSVDFGVRLNGYCGDSAVTIAVGAIDSQRLTLMKATKESLDIAIKMATPGIKWSQIAGEMQKHVESYGFSMVTEFVGHGIGRQMHEEPQVPNFVSKQLLARDIVLKEGMVLAVEPMVNAGLAKTKILNDGWTVATKDGKSSAHFEHTIAIVKTGCEVLTVK